MSSLGKVGVAAARIEHPREWPVYSAAAVERVGDLLRAGRSFDYGHGPEIAEIEQIFSERHGGRHAVTFNSATSALLAAYAALGVGPGDEVIVPSYSFLATASPLLLLGATPVLADAGAETGNLTAASIAARLTERTRAVAVTHLFGHPCEMGAITALCERHGLALVEDCSHAHGSTVDGVTVGSFGVAAVYSLGSHKLVSGGLGGILLTPEDELHDRACLLGHFKHRCRQTVIDPELRRLEDFGLGGNLRMAPTAAVLATDHASRLDELVETKRRNAEALLEAFAAVPGVDPLPRAPNVTMGGWHDIVVSVDPDRCRVGRDPLVDLLQDRGVRARVPSTRPLHRTSVFTGWLPDRWLRYDADDRATRFALRPEEFPVCERLDARWISLPATYFNREVPALLDAYVHAIASLGEELA